MANAQADFQTTLAKNHIQWALEEQEYAERKKEMEKEIQALEARRLIALAPIEILNKGANQRLEEAKTFLTQLKTKEEHAEELAEKLQDKLDKVGQKEQDLKKEFQLLEAKKQNIKLQEDSNLESLKNLNKQMLEFSVSCQVIEKDLQDKKTTLFLKERTLVAKEETLKRTDKALTDLATQLQDERGVLQRAWDELKRISPLNS